MSDQSATPVPATERRWFQFRLRTICVLVTVTALLAAWIGNELRVVAARRTFQPRFNDTESCIRGVSIPFPDVEVPTVPLIRQILGDRPGYLLMYFPSEDRDGRNLRRVQSLFPEATIFGPPGVKDLPKGVRELEYGTYFIM